MKNLLLLEKAEFSVMHITYLLKLGPLVKLVQYLYVDDEFKMPIAHYLIRKDVHSVQNE